MAILLPSGKFSSETLTGAPLVGGKVYAYVPNTSTPKDTYTSVTESVQNPHPVILDARGEATIYWSGSYDVILKDANGVTIWGPERLQETGSADDLEARLASTASAADGASFVGVENTWGPSYLKTLSDIANGEEVIIDRLLPQAQISAIRAYTSAYDCASDLNDAFSDFTNGGGVFFNYGLYNIGSAVALPNYFTLRGAGQKASRIKNINSGGGHALTAIGTGPDAPLSRQHISLRDFSIEGAPGSGDGIHGVYIVDSTIERVRIVTCGGYGLFTDNAFSNTFYRMYLSDNANHNMRLAAASNNNNIIACRSLNAGGASHNKSGYLFSDGFGSSFIGCTAESNGIGIEIAAGSNLTIKGYYAEANRDHSIRVGSVSTVTGLEIANSYMDGLVAGTPTADYSIYAQRADGLKIARCRMGNVTADHLLIGTVTGLVEELNTYFGTGTTRNGGIGDVKATSGEIGVSFGGGATGITYSARSMRTIKTGRSVYVAFLIALSNKGSSTGTAQITGLQESAVGATAAGGGAITTHINMAGLTGSPTIQVDNGATTATLQMFGATNSANMTDANFANNSAIYGFIEYETT